MADATPTTFRTCAKCGVSKPHTLDYFQPQRRQCRACRGLGEGPDRIRTGGRLKGGGSLSPDERRERNRARSRNYHLLHRDEQNAKMRAARAADPEKYRESDRKNYERNKKGTDYHKRRYQRTDKQAAKAALTAWRKANPEKEKAMWKRTYEKHKETHKARGLRWLRNNPEKAAAKRDRRRAKELGAAGNYTADDVAALLKAHGRVCFYCGAALTKFHVDHFIPLARGGSNWPDNLRLSCPTCNCSKGGKMPWEWKPDRFSSP